MVNRHILPFIIHPLNINLDSQFFTKPANDTNAPTRHQPVLDGPEGLLDGKRAIIACARGGKYGADNDHQTPCVRQFLSFLGLDDVRMVYAEGLAMGDDAEDIMSGARNEVERLATTI